MGSTRQEARNVNQGNQRNIERVAETYETSCLAACVDVQYTCHKLGLVSDDTYTLTVETSEAGDDVTSVQLLRLQELAIINDSAENVSVYYYTNDYSNLNLLKEVSSGNMSTFILLENNTSEGKWTTLRTMETLNAEQVEKYTSNILDTIEINWNQIQGNTSPIVFDLASVLPGTAVKSIYLKTVEPFVISESDETLTLKVSIGTGTDESDEDYDDDHFISEYDLTQPVADNNFAKDLFDEILSTSENKEICATITGTNLSLLTGGKLQITIERAKVIDPTILRNPIIQTQVPIGVVMPYTLCADSTDTPEGFFRLDGGEYPNANASIPDFVEKLNSVNNRLLTEKLIIGIDQWNQIFNSYGSCGKFAWNGSSLRFPAINCFIQGVNDLNQISKLTPAGLPNITGDAAVQTGMNTSYRTGAFYISQNNVRVDSGGSNSHSYPNLAFDASRCSSVYGNSDTVTPTNVKYPYIISVYNKIQNASIVDLNELITDTVYKANTNFDNVLAPSVWSSNFKNNVISLMMPNYSSAMAVNFPYTATMNGYCLIHQADNNYEIYIDGVLVHRHIDEASGLNCDDCLIPISKGEQITFTLTGSTGRTPTIDFIPCKGAI